MYRDGYSELCHLSDGGFCQDKVPTIKNRVLLNYRKRDVEDGYLHDEELRSSLL